MKAVIQPVERKLIMDELTSDKFIRNTRRGDNKLFEVTAENSPYTMREIGRLREISFRLTGGGTGKSIDIDSYDTDLKNGYKQLIVWDPKDKEILGGYRYIQCTALQQEHMATHELFNFSEEFKREYMPFIIELGRSFIQPNYQSTNIKRKGLFALDNLWDGLGALILRYPNIKYFFGKVTMYSNYNTRARNTLLYFLNHYFKDSLNLVTPKFPLDYDIENRYFKELFDGVEYNEGYKKLSKEVRGLGENIPPLINSYMNLSPSMKVFGTAFNSTFGDVEETGIMINIKDIYPEKLDRHLTPLRRLALKFRPYWWRNRG
ncbi:MAG: GNAT family N-acetyltransferase [Bacteroidales bacterium]